MPGLVTDPGSSLWPATGHNLFMSTYSVPVVIEINGSIVVEAESLEEAIDLAKQEYDRRYDSNMNGRSFGGLAGKVVDCPDVQVDFAHGDDPEAVEVVDGDES